jgi:hypothetical protein
MQLFTACSCSQHLCWQSLSLYCLYGFLYFMLLHGSSVHQLLLPVAVLSLLLLVAEFTPILLIFWAVLFSRMEIWKLGGLVLVCSRLLVHLFLSIQRSMRHLLLLALLMNSSFELSLCLWQGSAIKVIVPCLQILHCWQFYLS